LKKKKNFILYFIGPNFTVQSLALPSLELLSESYEIICISEGPKIKSDYFDHIPIPFKRKPSLLVDIKCLLRIIKIIFKHPGSIIVTSTPKMSLIVSVCSKVLLKNYRYIHRGAVYQNFKGLKKYIYKSIDEFIIHNSEITTFISESLFNSVKKELNLTTPIYNRNFNSSKGVNTEIFKPSSYSNQKLKIGYLGRICEDKGLDDIYKLIDDTRFTNYQIEIKGRLEISDSNKFFNLIKNKNIKFSNWDSNPELFLQSIDVLFFPSKREGFGNVAMEAASCGVPTVAYSIPGVTDAIKHNKSGILVKKNNSIVDALHELICDKELLTRLKKSARQYALENFNQRKVLDDLHKSLDL